MSPMQHQPGPLPVTSLIALLGVACLGAVRPTMAGEYFAGGDDEHPRHLFICAGDQARKAPDFLAVISFDERSQHGHFPPLTQPATSRTTSACHMTVGPSRVAVF